MCDDSYLIVWELVPGLLAIGKDFPEDNTQTPYITLCSEPPVHDALWGHPANGQHSVTTHLLFKKTMIMNNHISIYYLWRES